VTVLNGSNSSSCTCLQLLVRILEALSEQAAKMLMQLVERVH
jgi:hypothetical protein